LSEGKQVLSGTARFEEGNDIKLELGGNWRLATKSQTYSIATFSAFVRKLVLSWYLTKEINYLDHLKHLVEDWANSTFIGEDWKWQPTIASVRLENLIFGLNVLTTRPFSLSSADMAKWSWLIVNHVAFLEEFLETPQANNHLVFNLCALLHFYSAIDQNGLSVEMAERHWRMLEGELHSQVCRDGGWGELSPYYHMIMMYWLLSLLIVSRKNGLERGEFLEPVLRRMLAWFKMILRPDNSIPLLNDSYAQSQFCSPNDLLILAGIVLQDLDAQRLARKNITENILQFLTPDSVRVFMSLDEGTITRPSCYLEDSGRFCLRSHIPQTDHVYVTFDTGPVGYRRNHSHGHADALSFELVVDGEPLLVDSGTDGYYRGEGRDYFRGTRGHNTVIVDGRDQSWLCGSMGFISLAHVTVHRYELGATVERIVASHDGYTFPRGRVLHTRELALDKGLDTLTIHDQLNGNGSHSAQLFFHLAPHLSVSKQDDSSLVIIGRGVESVLRHAPNIEVDLFRGSQSPFVGWFADRESAKVETTTIRLSLEFSNSILVPTYISWKRKGVV
jgi:uncharacterized heparinase superfamily protein